jgi:hypothetical protein
LKERRTEHVAISVAAIVAEVARVGIHIGIFLPGQKKGECKEAMVKREKIIQATNPRENSTLMKGRLCEAVSVT